MKLLSIFNAFITLLLLQGCAKASQEAVPAHWDYGEAAHFYNSTDDLAIVDTIIKNKGGYNNPNFFPTSINLLINRGLSENRQDIFDSALKNLIQMEDHIGRLDYIAYKEFIPHIKANYLRSSFDYTNEIKCPSEIENLKDTHSNASFAREKVQYEYTYWFSLYVNSACSTAETRAIYISALAQLDSEKAKIEFNKIISQGKKEGHGESVQFRETLCHLREEYNGYDTKNGIYQLEKTGLIKCQKKLLN